MTMLGSPIHRILVVFPLGLLATSFFFDLAWLAFKREDLAITAQWLIFSGVIGSLAASVFGVLDWLRMPRHTHARRIGAWHGGGHTLVALLFSASWAIRHDLPSHPEGVAIALSALGVLLTVLTAWLSSELSDWRAGV